MKRLIADLLQLSRMDKGVDKLTWSDFDLNELIRRVLIGRMNDIEDKSLNVQIDFCTEPLPGTCRQRPYFAGRAQHCG